MNVTGKNRTQINVKVKIRGKKLNFIFRDACPVGKINPGNNYQSREDDLSS